jgi:hypothetical protein
MWLPYGRCVVRRAGIQVRRTRHLPNVDIVVRKDGIRVTSPPRTAFDAAEWLRADDLESLIEQGIERPYFTIPTLWAHARRLCRNGRAGNGRFASRRGAGRLPRTTSSDWSERCIAAAFRSSCAGIASSSRPAR